MQSLKTWTVFSLVLFGIPALGWIAGVGLSSHIENQFIDAVMNSPQAALRQMTRADVIPFSEACERASFRAALEPLCGTYENLQILQIGSVWSAIGGFSVIALVWLTARLCRGSQSLLAYAFSVEIRLVLASMCVLIFAQGAILTYAAYMLEATLVHSVHFALIGGIGLGAIAGGFAMARAAARLSPRLKTFAIALAGR